MTKEKKASRRPVRQGDVWLEPVDEAPPGMGDEIPREKTDRVILALGEKTGHHHHIFGPEGHAKLFALRDSTDRILCLKGVGLLKHEEHAPITLQPGNYRVRIQEEYSPAELRMVQD